MQLYEQSLRWAKYLFKFSVLNELLRKQLKFKTSGKYTSQSNQRGVDEGRLKKAGQLILFNLVRNRRIRWQGQTATLKAGDIITFPGFGTFSVSERAARKGRNPQTGAEPLIAASKSGKFAAGKDLNGS
jgi:Bacterial DNA-binding protein